MSLWKTVDIDSLVLKKKKKNTGFEFSKHYKNSKIFTSDVAKMWMEIPQMLIIILNIKIE